MKYLLLFLMLISSSVFAVTPNQNYANREPQRKEYAQSMQRTHDMLDRSIAAASNGNTVTQTGSASATATDGSKISGGGSVTKPINPSGVGKAIVSRLEKAKALGKASLPAFLGSAALQALLDAIGWVMDPDNNTIKMPNPETGQYKYGINDIELGSTPDIACSISSQRTQSQWIGKLRLDSSRGEFGYCVSDAYQTGFMINRYRNSDYKPDDYKAVSNPELEQAITNYVTNNTTNNITNNIVNNAYSYDSSNGASSADPSNALAVDAANDIRSAVNNASTSSSPNPAGSQRGYYKITDGTKTIEGYVDAGSTTGSGSSNNDSTTVTNPDGSTTTTGTTNIELNLPAFCDWASIVCDWYKDWKQSDQVYKDHMTKTEEHQEQEKTFWEKVTDWFDWTKESPQDKDQPEQEEPDTQGIFSKKFDAFFSLSKECPPDLKFNLETKYLTGTWDFSLNWLCIFFTFIAYPLQLLSHMIGLWVLYEACIRKEIKW